MLKRLLQVTCGMLSCMALAANSGCASAKGACVTRTASSACGTPCATKTVAYSSTRTDCVKPAGELTAELPPYAKPGECYTKVWVPPQFKTVSERICVRPASERLEIVPAKYEWVEERVCVKEASTQLIEQPAQFATRDVTVQVASGHTDWEVNKAENCDMPKGTPAKDVFCLVSHPPETRTIQTQCLVKPACVKQEIIPAQYETVRRQKLVSAATTRKICIPAEYQNVEKTVKVCDGRMAWKRVICEKPEGQTAYRSNINLQPSNEKVIKTTKTVRYEEKKLDNDDDDDDRNDD